MPGPSRKDRLESLLYREIAVTVQQDLRDPRIGFVTITRVEMTADLQQVKAFFTVLGTDKQKALASKTLQRATSFVQRKYASAVHTRLLPQLTFAYDDSEQRRQGMSELIHRARSTDADGGATSANIPNPDMPPSKKRRDADGYIKNDDDSDDVGVDGANSAADTAADTSSDADNRE